jgi:hypothetical protein
MASMPPIYDRVMSRRYDQSCPSLERNQPVPVAVCRQANPFIPAGLRVHAATLFAESQAFARHDQELAGSSREVCLQICRQPETVGVCGAVASQGWLHRLVLHAGFEVRRSQ